MKSESIQSSFLSGVLDPRASARIDTDAYHQGLLDGKNVIPLQLGGLRRRPGLPYIGTAPFKVTQVAVQANYLAPQGGTISQLFDNDPTTTFTTTADVSTIDPYVVLFINLGTPTLVQYASVEGLASVAGSSTHFQIQYSTDNMSWTTLGTEFTAVDSTPRAYLREGPVTAQYWRVAKIGGTDMGATKMKINEFNIWTMGSVVSEVRTIPFEVSTTDQYVVMLTERIGSIYRVDGTLVSRVQTPYLSADLALIDADNDAETMVIVHPNYPQRFLFREVSENFQTLEIVFDFVPKVDYADSLSPIPVIEVQHVTFAAQWVEGETYQMNLDGAQSGPVQYAGDSDADSQAATAENLRKAVQGLYTVPGFTGVAVVALGANVYEVSFSGASANTYHKVSATALSSSAKILCTRITPGSPRVEPLWSATRGFARTVAFFEERLVFGGFRSQENTLTASVISNILNFDRGGGLADDAMVITLSGGKLNSIQGMLGGRALEIFTAAAEFRFITAVGSTIIPGDKPLLQTQYGSKRIRPVTMDGATLYVQATGKAIRDFRYDYRQIAYDSLGVSALAPHLINGVVDLAAWNGSRTDEIGLVFIVNGDGTLAVFNSRKEANTQAFTNWDTQGLFKSVAVVREAIFFAVRRTINGVDAVFLEKTDDTYYTDAAVQYTGVAATVVTGLGHLNGAVCRTRSDSSVTENVTPAAGSVTLSDAASAIEVGLGWTPTITPMPLVGQTAAGPNFMKKRRIVKIYVKLRNTLGLRVNGNLLADYRLDTDSFDTAATPFSGVRSVEETTNWDLSDEKLVTFTQPDPLPLEMQAIHVTMESA